MKRKTVEISIKKYNFTFFSQFEQNILFLFFENLFYYNILFILENIFFILFFIIISKISEKKGLISQSRTLRLFFGRSSIYTVAHRTEVGMFRILILFSCVDGGAILRKGKDAHSPLSQHIPQQRISRGPNIELRNAWQKTWAIVKAVNGEEYSAQSKVLRNSFYTILPIDQKIFKQRRSKRVPKNPIWKGIQ